MHQTLLIYTSYNIISGVAALILFSAMLLALDEKIQSFIKKIYEATDTSGFCPGNITIDTASKMIYTINDVRLIIKFSNR
jgi:hypothetical protein